MQSEVIKLEREAVRKAMIEELFRGLETIPEGFTILDRTIEGPTGQRFIQWLLGSLSAGAGVPRIVLRVTN